MTYTIIAIAIFVVGYVAIALEHTIKVNKAASALITGVLCWTIYFLHSGTPASAGEELTLHLGEIASIVFFLLGAMTIVELIDSHNGFDIISRQITTTSKRRLLLIIAIITFLLSSLLDNLTTSIVMTSLCLKIIPGKEDRLWFAGIIIIAANAGGAWSPLGDVTTTMLWIGGQITAINIIKTLLLPSIAVCVIPAWIVSMRFKSQKLAAIPASVCTTEEQKQGKLMLFSGIGLLLFVPAFKSVTHLPPFMGMLLALGLIWVITTFIHRDKPAEYLERFTVTKALQKIDAPSILFFLGILLAVTAIQALGILTSLANALNGTLKNDYLIGIVLGLLSSIVDNVPLVAACQGMYDLQTYPPDHHFWEFLALTTGTGGSAIIIGSAAGVAVMGIEKINFTWYLKNISWLALLGFAAGVATFLIEAYLTT
ncbi:MAG TPA: sodium:proton antiporter NhaD [Chitinophagaceae bacterium]|nr:sodium:proton antiporter NhaD [Chitinophagaceae bacterium]